MKLSRLLNHLTLRQLEVYQTYTDAILECNAGVFEEVILEVTQ